MSWFVAALGLIQSPLLWGLHLFGAMAIGMPRPAKAALSPGRAGAKRGWLVPPRFTFAPYLQDVSEDGLVVAWATDVMTTGSVHIFELESKLQAQAAPESSPGPAPELTPRAMFHSPLGLHHRVRVTGLRAGTRYRYVVRIRRPGTLAQHETAAPAAEFSTASSRGPFVFLVYGDTRDRDGDHAAVVHAMVKEHADLVIQTGDMVSRASDESQWRRYFATASPLLRSAPLYPALGNHELRGDPEATHFHRLFVLPQGLDGPKHPRRRPVYYAFRYGNSLFMILDGNSPYDTEQAAWVERTLHASRADTALRHTFVFVHQPPFAVGAYCGSERLARRLVPLLQRHAVRALFAGHEHAYQHLERDGMRYFISGGGGAPLYQRSQACNFEDDMALRLFRAEHHYLRVEVDGDTVTLLAIGSHGNLIERVPLDERVSEPPRSPILEPPSGGPPYLYTPPRLALSALGATIETDLNAETETAEKPRSAPAAKAPLHLTDASPSFFESGFLPGNGPLLLLWLSSMALISGLFILTQDLRLRRRTG